MKPFTSKHCEQYLSKSSPFNQGKELAEKYKPKGKPVLKEPNLIEHVGLLKPVDIQKISRKIPDLPPSPKREYIEIKQREKVKPVSVLKTNK